MLDDPKVIEGPLDQILLGCIIVGSFIILSGIITIVGALKRWRCILCIYVIFALFYLTLCLGFLAIGIAAGSLIDDNVPVGNLE